MLHSPVDQATHDFGVHCNGSRSLFPAQQIGTQWDASRPEVATKKHNFALKTFFLPIQARTPLGFACRPRTPRAHARPKDNLMTATRYCPRCAKMVPFGIHPCTAARKAEASTATKAPAVKNDGATPTATINTSINATINTEEAATINNRSKRSARDKRYRDAHRERYNAYHRDYMRRRRADARASAGQLSFYMSS